jgi:hypothetical protein
MVSMRVLLFCKSVWTKILFHINSALIKLFMFYAVCALRDVVYLCDKTNRCTYRYVQSHIIGLHQHVMVTAVTIIRVCYNKNIIHIQL